MGQKFWNSHALEPKRQHRWLLRLGHNLPAYAIKTADKPSFTINETEHAYFGHKFFYPGTVTWNEITVTFVDPINPDVSDRLMSLLKKAGYQDPSVGNTGTPQLPTVSKSKAVLNNVVMTQYGVDREKKVETWSLKNAWIKDVKFGTLDYSSDELVEVELTLRFDWAIYKSYAP